MLDISLFILFIVPLILSNLINGYNTVYCLCYKIITDNTHIQTV